MDSRSTTGMSDLNISILSCNYGVHVTVPFKMTFFSTMTGDRHSWWLLVRSLSCTNFVSFSSFLTLSIFSLSLPHYHSLLLSPYLSSSLYLSLSAFQLSKTLCVSVSISLTHLYFPSCSFLPLILLVPHLLFYFFLFVFFLQASLRSSLSSFYSSSPSFASSLIVVVSPPFCSACFSFVTVIMSFGFI